ncbi:CocE/NonD family hydrolase [Cereibacter sediminicola]|uniref:CocE/NonD family hydrolase n=1 Tax=Cereibacter sediminicola TaxID=2584941 RepID=UPI001642591D|nr:CocE/NonD family hydrolase [Cereibacter sediminicola]
MIRPGLAALLLLAFGLALALFTTGRGERLLEKARLWAWRNGSPAFGHSVESLAVPAGDGTLLATDIYLPKGAGPFPSILIRLPYDKRRYGEVLRWVRLLRPRGYAVVAQDMRGRHGSEGVFAPYPHERADAVATLDWIVAQDWSNGRVGTVGCSALGETQVLLAAERHPAHQAMIPLGAGGAMGALDGRASYFGAFEGGILNLASAFGWFVAYGGKTPDRMAGVPVDHARALRSLPLIDMMRQARPDPTDWEDFLRRFEDRGYWKAAGYIDDTDRFATPGLMVDTWYDPSISGSFALTKAMRTTAPGQHLIVAPGTHCNHSGAASSGAVADLPVGPEALLPFDEIFVTFLDHRLKDRPAPDLPPYLYYMLVENRWREAGTWPPEGAVAQEMLLASEGHAQTAAGDGRLLPPPGAALPFPGEAPAAPASDGIVSDPADPVPSVGGAICCTGDPEERAGPLYQDRVEARPDVLVYSSAPARADLPIAGPLSARLRVSTDTLDADIVARLSDVDPAGRSRMIQEGALRLRYRKGFDHPRPMEPGEVAEVTVEMRHIAYLLKAGHRLRLTLAGSSFPRLERNLNTGGANAEETGGRPARIVLHTGRASGRGSGPTSGSDGTGISALKFFTLSE